MKWLTVYGGAVGTGNIRDVIFGGSPNGDLLGFSLASPHASDRGRGLGFEQHDNNTITVRASLIGIVVDSNNRHYDWNEYFPFNGLYQWFLDIKYSTTGANGQWHDWIHNPIANHQGNPPAGLGNRWSETAIEHTVTTPFPANATHLKISIYEKDRTDFSRDPIIPIEDIIEDFKPWAIRKDGGFKSFDRPSGFLKVRKADGWKDRSKQKESDKNALNRGSSRIRKDSGWRGQGRFGTK